MRYLAICSYLMVCAGCGEGLGPDESAMPYPPLEASAYCPTAQDNGKLVPACWSLSLRQEILERYENMEFSRTEYGCRLENPQTGYHTRFACGELLLGVLEGVATGDLRRVVDLTQGQLVRFQPGEFGFGKLLIPVGTEVEAMGKIIFNPDLRYVSVNHNEPYVDWLYGPSIPDDR